MIEFEKSETTQERKTASTETMTSTGTFMNSEDEAQE